MSAPSHGPSVTVLRAAHLAFGQPSAAAFLSAARPQMIRQDFTDVPGAPTAITSAQPAAAHGSLPAYCEVRGYIEHDRVRGAPATRAPRGRGGWRRHGTYAPDRCPARAGRRGTAATWPDALRLRDERLGSAPGRGPPRAGPRRAARGALTSAAARTRMCPVARQVPCCAQAEFDALSLKDSLTKSSLQCYRGDQNGRNRSCHGLDGGQLTIERLPARGARGTADKLMRAHAAVTSNE